MENRKWIHRMVALLAVGALVVPTVAQADIASDLYSFMAQANGDLEAMGSDVRLEVIEYYTGQEEAGQTVFFGNTGNKQLAYDFVPGDPRRTAWSGPVGPGDDITSCVKTNPVLKGEGFDIYDEFDVFFLEEGRPDWRGVFKTRLSTGARGSESSRKPSSPARASRAR